MSDSEMPEDDRAKAGEYALGLMTRAEAAEFAARLDREPGLAALVARWQEDFAMLADEVEPVAPPARVRRRIEARLFDDTKSPRWLAPGVMGLLAASLALVLLFVPVGTGVRPPANPLYHADLASESGELILAAGYDGETGELYVIPELAPEEGTAHELWLIEGDNPPVSLGLMPADAPARVLLAPEQAQALQGAVLAISVEPPTGSPTGAPTGPVIATGEVMTL
ncbi:anti-sigma factor [Maritimibacter dapengensis]|uniref:Anti-sigma factor n=1 Tax=Maritimibacter dapengensis TaxID=2836868 RepID=A0ABS6T228_9RHOB|nr:anti-sigma factor [Maritimibacter dapengensis]MBV7379035.1 anti-sigma factor [Maritimibacter dapengensis]